MVGLIVGIVIAVVVLGLVLLAGALHIVQQYEKGVVFRFGRVIGEKQPGLVVIVPFVNVLRKVSFRIVTMPIQSQGIITRDNVSVDVSAVAYYRVVDATKSVVAIENVEAAINQIAQTTLRKVVGQHTLDEMLAETDRINVDIKEILDAQTAEWGVIVTLVELKDIQLPETMKRAMARQAEAEREKRAKIIAAEGESLAAAALGEASDMMMEHPLALQLRNSSDADRDRRRQEHDGRVPWLAHEHDPGDGGIPFKGDCCRRKNGKPFSSDGRGCERIPGAIRRRRHRS